MNAKDFLRQSYRLNEMINSNVEELDNLRDLATNIAGQTFDKDKLSGCGYVKSRVEEIVLKVVEYQHQVNEEIDQLVDLKKDIRKSIMRVTDRDQLILLRLRYLNSFSWQEIQQRMNLCEKQIHRIHGESLKFVHVPEKYLIKSDKCS